MKFQIIQNDFTSRALRKEVGQVGFRRQPLFLQYLLRIFGLLCLGVSAFCLVTVGMSIANPGISPWKYTLLTFLYAIPFLFLGLHYMNLVPAAHGNFILRNTFARRTEFRSDSFAEYIGDRKSEYQYRELGEVLGGERGPLPLCKAEKVPDPAEEGLRPGGAEELPDLRPEEDRPPHPGAADGQENCQLNPA